MVYCFCHNRVKGVVGTITSGLQNINAIGGELGNFNRIFILLKHTSSNI